MENTERVEGFDRVIPALLSPEDRRAPELSSEFARTVYTVMEMVPHQAPTVVESALSAVRKVKEGNKEGFNGNETTALLRGLVNVWVGRMPTNALPNFTLDKANEDELLAMLGVIFGVGRKGETQLDPGHGDQS